MISKDNPPQQQALLPSSFGFGHEIRHLQHQNLGHQVGNFFLPQPPNHNEVLIASSLPNSSSHLYDPTCNQAKKDRRNTKIKTANGVRDRRVRLSMGIAREFFDLQDMLGFDRASKTLGWLLAKSKGAIQELALEKQRLDQFQDGSFSFGATDDLVSASAAAALESASASYNYNDKIEKGNVGVSQGSVVRENRVKARARARARTREKMSSTIAKPVQIDHCALKGIGKGDSANSLAADSKTKLHYDGMNVMMNQDSSRLVSCTSYLQDHPIAPGSNPESTISSSISGWNIFDQFPNW